MKKFLSILLTLLMLCSVVTSTGITVNGAESAVSSTSVTSGDFEYEALDETTAEITGYVGSDSKITIPTTLDGYTVVSIGNDAFKGCTGLTSITIPGSVTSIGNYAFSKCTNLTSITIPDSVTSIGNYAFYSCTGLTSVYIPDSIESIDAYAFKNTGYYKDNSNWIDGVLYIDNFLLEAQSTITNCNIKSGTKNITPYALKNCTNLTNVTIPDSVESIGDFAFNNCESLTSITIPDSVISIGVAAFGWCTNLTSVELGNGVTNIGSSAFNYCTSLTSITVPKSVTSIGSNVFKKCTSLINAVIDEGVESISTNMFYECTSLTNVTIPSSVTSVGTFAFYGCTNLKGVYISDIVSWCSIEFKNKSDTNPLLYSGKLYLNHELVTELVIPDSCTNIKNWAFSGCTSLTSVTIPDSVTSIGWYAFSNCDDLVIYGYDGSYAQTYAKENDIKFVIIKTSLNATKKNMNSGDTFKITVNNANGAKVKYSISNADKKIIKVSAKGKVTALQKGTATVNVKVGSTTLKCKITVKTDPYLTNAKGKKITSVTVKKGGKVTVYIQGKAKSLKNAYVGNKTAKISGNKSKAKFNVKGLKKGTTTVKVKINRVKTLNLRVKVK